MWPSAHYDNQHFWGNFCVLPFVTGVAINPNKVLKGREWFGDKNPAHDINVCLEEW
jgi:hypothetical protein